MNTLKTKANEKEWKRRCAIELLEEYCKEHKDLCNFIVIYQTKVTNNEIRIDLIKMANKLKPFNQFTEEIDALLENNELQKEFIERNTRRKEKLEALIEQLALIHEINVNKTCNQYFCEYKVIKDEQPNPNCIN